MKTTAESVTNSEALQISGGFRIKASPDELTVTKVRSNRDRLSLLLMCAVVSCWLVFDSADRFSSIAVLLLFAGISVAWYLFGVDHNLRCTREDLGVVDVVRGHIKQTRRYPRADVKGVQFGAVSQSRYGATCGLIFDVMGERVKTLYGLKCVEAQRILDELQRLGFVVCRDPGIPMMVEMELSRRNSWLGRWLY